jgi:hypothetical protein
MLTRREESFAAFALIVSNGTYLRRLDGQKRPRGIQIESADAPIVKYNEHLAATIAPIHHLGAAKSP